MMRAGPHVHILLHRLRMVGGSSACFRRVILSPNWLPNTAHHLAGGGDYVEEEEEVA